MKSTPELTEAAGSKWRGIGLIAITYFYFLIFAQFGFLHRVGETVGPEYWEPILGAMGVAGLIGSLLAGFGWRTGARLHGVLLGAAVGSGLAGFAAGSACLFAAAILSGFFLGALTVALVSELALRLPRKGIGWICGLGTGLAYLLSNVPVVFNASAAMQCWLAATACGAGFVFAWPQRIAGDTNPSTAIERPPVVPALFGLVLIFGVLIWADSAAFTRIQESPDLKAHSWSGSGRLWAIGAAHFLAGLLGGFLMESRRSFLLYAVAFAALFLGLRGLESNTLGLAPALLYAAGVSLYSCALVAFALVREMSLPLLSVGLIYGLAGWLASGLGIGMERALGGVPDAFWLLSALVLTFGLFLTAKRNRYA